MANGANKKDEVPAGASSKAAETATTPVTDTPKKNQKKHYADKCEMRKFQKFNKTK